MNSPAGGLSQGWGSPYYSASPATGGANFSSQLPTNAPALNPAGGQPRFDRRQGGMPPRGGFGRNLPNLPGNGNTGIVPPVGNSGFAPSPMPWSPAPGQFSSPVDMNSQMNLGMGMGLEQLRIESAPVSRGGYNLQ
ncbi:hypothetical protein [Planctomicrobium sp. SH664]|uniref:hypothetical protein n=1 Tax=Planctomicrobium sp. SH664 TaxID=3448125 RepID=UPI003F5CADB6